MTSDATEVVNLSDVSFSINLQARLPFFDHSLGNSSCAAQSHYTSLIELDCKHVMQSADYIHALFVVSNCKCVLNSNV